MTRLLWSPTADAFVSIAKKINLSTCLAGQAVGIKEVGYVDLEEKTLQPLDNPFGPKALPMS